MNPRIINAQCRSDYNIPEGILLMEKNDLWEAFEKCLGKFPAGFMKSRRQPRNQNRLLNR